MSINGITNSVASTYSQMASSASKAKSNPKTEAVSTQEETGVVYEPSNATESADANSKITDYQKIVKHLQGELSAKNQQLQNLVDQLLSKQANKYTKLCDLFQDIKDGKINVDPEVVEQAKKDVAEDGYWGIEQTSDRMVSMAQALSGGDSTKADEMIAAIKKGFDQAAEAWGGELPEISQKTVDAAIKKLENWRDGVTETEETAEAEA